MEKKHLVSGIGVIGMGLVFFALSFLDSRLQAPFCGFGGACLGAGIAQTIKYVYWSKPERRERYQEKMENMKITISVQTVCTPDQMLKIEISDNGRGFSEEQLKELNQPLSSGPYSNEHIGILNVRRRLSYLYGSKCSLSFSNTEEYGGAKITAFLPMHLPEPFASHTMTEFKEEAHEFITCR